MSIVSKISPCHSFLSRYINVFMNMRGWADPVTKILVFATEILVTSMKIFSYELSSSGYPGQKFKKKIYLHGQNGIVKNGLVCISTLGVCELTLLVKLQGFTKLCWSRTI